MITNAVAIFQLRDSSSFDMYSKLPILENKSFLLFQIENILKDFNMNCYIYLVIPCELFKEVSQLLMGYDKYVRILQIPCDDFEVYKVNYLKLVMEVLPSYINNLLIIGDNVLLDKEDLINLSKNSYKSSILVSPNRKFLPKNAVNYDLYNNLNNSKDIVNCFGVFNTDKSINVIDIDNASFVGYSVDAFCLKDDILEFSRFIVTSLPNTVTSLYSLEMIAEKFGFNVVNVFNDNKFHLITRLKDILSFKEEL